MKTKNFIIFYLVMSVISFLNISSLNIASASERPNIIFIHHSVGASLIRDSGLRHIFTEAGFDFWDHGYNHPEYGLRNEKGEPAGSYWIPENNTNPDGIANLFKLAPDGKNAFSRILNNHNVIIFKSCFPVSQIKEDNLLKDLIDPKRRSFYNYKRHYLSIRDTVDKQPEKIFIIVTQPPMHPNATNEDEAKRARSFVKWLKSGEYLGKRKNLFVFDYFDLLADQQTNMLRTEYQIDPEGQNSHPNPIAQMLIAPHFAAFVINVFRVRNNSDLPEVTFDNPAWPYNLIRLSSPIVSLSGKVKSHNGIKKILWTDLKGHGNEILPHKSWKINNITVSPGVTKVIVTAIDKQGLRSSSAIGLQYYSGKPKQVIIFDESLVKGSLDGLSDSDENPYEGKKNLFIRGTGQPNRVAINRIQLDISDCDPETTYLEFHYDQGFDNSKPRLFIIGIGDLYLNVNNKPGYEKIIVPFNKFKYVHNTLNKLVLKGNWGKDAKVYLDSIRLVCSMKKV